MASQALKRSLGESLPSSFEMRRSRGAPQDEGRVRSIALRAFEGNVVSIGRIAKRRRRAATVEKSRAGHAIAAALRHEGRAPAKAMG